MTKPIMRTGGRILVDQLRIQGCDRIFTVPGESFLAALDAFHDTPDIDVVVCRQEGNEVIRVPMQTVCKTEPGLSKGSMHYLPYPQADCHTSRECAKRMGEGLQPRCVLSCPARAMTFGPIDKLSEYMKKKSIPHASVIPF